MLHRRAYLYSYSIVPDVRMVHCGKLHFRPNTRCIHTLRHEVVTNMGNPFGMLLVPRFARHVQHRSYAVGYGLCLGYHTPSSFASSFVVPAG